MVVVEQILRLGDRRIGQAVRLEGLRDDAGIERGQAFAQQRYHPIAGAHPIIVAGQPRVGDEIVIAEGLAEQGPLRVGDDGKENLLVAGDREHVIDGPGGNAAWHRRWLLARHRILHHVLRDEEDVVFE